MASETGRGGVRDALLGRLPVGSKDEGRLPGCPAEDTATDFRTAESPSGA